MKIDRTTLLLALIISIILTLLLLSTYSQTQDGITKKGIGWHMIEGLSDYHLRPVLVSLIIASTVFFCIEIAVSYFVIYKLKMWKQNKK